MKVLLLGSGGREHALAWKLKQSPRVEQMYIAPGNGGTELLGQNVPIAVTEFEQLAAFAAENSIDLTIVGPDDPLSLGIVDFFEAKGLRIWGPSRAAAQIEASKAFAKEIMREAGIPTAASRTFTDYEHAIAYVKEREAPIVVKASGLALGKGVVVAEATEAANAALKDMMVDRIFGEAGDQVVIEEFLTGPEISVHALCRENTYTLFPPAQDHKRALDGDLGKNTGGMGTIAPLPFVTEEMMREIGALVIEPLLRTMSERGTPFNGLLFPGLIMTNGGPKVLEFNARFGDPETQSFMRLLESDLLDLIEGKGEARWNSGYAANIVLASGGYPDAYKKEVPISGLAEAEKEANVVVFHAGTKIENGQLVTNGGRVLGISAIGKTLKDALDAAYRAADAIQFEGKQYRRDIGAKANL